MSAPMAKGTARNRQGVRLMSRRHLSRFALLTIIFAAGTFAATGLTSTAAKASPPCQAKKSNCPPAETTTTTSTTTTTTSTTATTGTTATTTTVAGTTPSPTPTIVTRFLSDLSWSVAVNGWGPTERDMTNGELGFGDGRTLTLNGATFPKGLGAHGKSEIRYAVPAGCSRFTASVGVDDEVGTRGTLAFHVFVGTTNLYDSGTMTGASATKLVDLAVSGGTELRLVITDAADGVNYDHGDWAAARFTCSTSSTPAPTTTAATTSTASTTTTTAATTTTAPAPSPSGVAAPQAPSPYAPPAGALYVRSSAELTSALAQSNRDIVLADGTYAKSGPFVNAGGNRLFAERVGGAVLTSGLVVGGNSAVAGSLVRGVVFDVASAASTLQGSIVHVWGPGGVNAQVLDCVFRGNRSVPYGIGAPNPEGMVAKRLQFYGFTDVAFRASNNQVVGYGAATPRINEISDIHVDGVTRGVPGSSNGTAEAGLWVGHPVTNGVHRVRIRNVSWSGIETVNNSWGTTFSDLDIDMSGPSQYAGVAVYMEHYNYYNVFTNFRIVGAKIGFTGEWADPSWGGKPGANYVTIRGGVVDALGSTLAGRQAGVYLDEGSNSTTVQDVVFRNQNWAGIGAYRNLGTNSFGSNQYSLKPGAVQISTDHI